MACSRGWAASLLASMLAACGSADDARRALLVGEAGTCDGGPCVVEAGLPDVSPALPEGSPDARAGDGQVEVECGNDILEDGEECDDGNRVSGDGCQADCLLPVCGDRVVDEGEQCDDGNAIDGDGCEANCTWSSCIEDADCDDEAFCNGVEQCVEGTCAAGEAPSLDDGIECTIDTCDEEAAAIVHVPDDSACASLDGEPFCAAEGEFAGRLVQDKGVCDAETGCGTTTVLVDDCLDDTLYPTTFSCAATGAARILRNEGTCRAAAAVCGYASSLEESCAGAIPDNHPFCSGSAGANNLTYHDNAQATCGGNPASCGFSERTTACAPGNSSCAGGELTTYTPTCTAATGCGRRANAPTPCPDTPNTCTGPATAPVHTTYAPACANARTCGSPTPTAETCTAPPNTCIGARLTTRTPTCSPANGCAVSTASSTCPAASPRCVTLNGVPNRRTFQGACNGAGTACLANGTPTDTPCTASADSCTAGTLTTYSPTCTGAGNCGEQATSTPCPDQPSTCTPTAGGPDVLTVYTPRCNRLGMACMTPLATQTVCVPGPTTCEGPGNLTHVQRPVQCNAAAETCTTTVSQDCSGTTYGCFINPTNAQQVLITYTGTCTPADGCGRTEISRQVCPNGCGRTSCL